MLKYEWLTAVPLLLLALGGCHQSTTSGGEMPVEKRESAVHCVGRYDFNLPDDFFALSGGSGEIDFGSGSDKVGKISFTVRDKNVGQEDFSNAVQQRLAALMRSKGKKTNRFEEAREISPNFKIFKINVVDDSHVAEAHIYKGGAYIIAKIDSFQESYPLAEAELKKLYENITPADINDGAGKGFCAGAVEFAGTHAVEWVSVKYRSKDRPDLSISITVDTFRPDEEKSLFERTTGPSSLFSVFDIDHKVLRKRELKVAAMSAQEWLAKIKDPDRKEWQHKFALETMRANPTLLLPHIHIEFSSGKTGADGVVREANISDAEAIALWDDVVRSIRPRP
jgi:hypothetical protein